MDETSQIAALIAHSSDFPLLEVTMPPKFDAKDPAIAALIASFESLGLPPPKATEAARSAKGAVALKAIIDQNGLEGAKLDEKQASLVASWAITAAKLPEDARDYGVRAIVAGKLKSAEQISGKQFLFSVSWKDVS